MDITMEKGPFMFLNEWQLLFSEEKVDDVKIQKYCINGCLNNSNIRTLAWRIILRILPLRRSEWTKALKKSREDYEAVKAKLNFDPRADKENIDDENINNPLCINTMNPWCIYFENSKLREIISKDVERTYPDLAFFQSVQIRELMVNILFTYSKCHPQISYRQGMHELLAPIIFVFNLDQRMYQQLKEQNCLSYSSQAGFSFEDIHLLQELNDSRFFEHDVYTMFSRLMKLVECFYLVRTDEEIANDLRSRAHSIATKHFKNHLARIPFSDPQHSDQDQSTIHRRLEMIHGELLMTIDPPLARHLNSLQVLPQVYGIRWLRLLFGREFSILELLTIWDIIFADQCSQSMINYIFVALLVQIRHSLLRSDYCTCVHLLMKYQSTQDVGVFIRFVLSLKYPQKFPIPDAMSDLALYVNPERTNARTEWIWAKNNLTPPFKEKMNRKHEDRVLDNVLNKIGRQALAAYPANFHKKERRQTPSESSSSEKNLQILNRRDLTRKTSPISNHGSHSEGEIELMKEQISLLQSRLNDMDCIGQISAQKIRGCADEKRMETPEGRRHLIDELNEIAEHLTRSTVSEQYIRQHVQPPPAVPNGMKGDAVELASEVLGFRAASSTLEAAAATIPISRSRLSSKTLPRSNNEMIELRFDKKKNY